LPYALAEPLRSTGYLPARIGGVITDSETCIAKALGRALDSECNLITDELIQSDESYAAGHDTIIANFGKFFRHSLVHKKKVRTSELSNRIKKYRRMAPAANKTQNPKTQEPFAPLSRASGA
jgi:hypothetical protein